MRWDIRSYDGAGPLHFGMLPQDAKSAVGAPFRTHTSRLTGNLLEMREPEFPDLTYDQSGLAEISFTPSLDQVFDGDLEVFAEPPIFYIKRLMADDPKLLISFGMIVSFSRGAFLHGFHCDDEPRRFGVFRQGHMDTIMDDDMTTPFVLP